METIINTLKTKIEEVKSELIDLEAKRSMYRLSIKNCVPGAEKENLLDAEFDTACDINDANERLRNFRRALLYTLYALGKQCEDTFHPEQYC